MPRNRSTLRLIRSSRLSSGLRRRPAVMQITSLVGNVLVAAGGDHLVGHQAGAVQQVERLAGGQFGVDVEQGDLAHDLAGLQGERRARADQARRRR